MKLQHRGPLSLGTYAMSSSDDLQAFKDLALWMRGQGMHPARITVGSIDVHLFDVLVPAEERQATTRQAEDDHDPYNPLVRAALNRGIDLKKIGGTDA